ncbi:hypothetical protein BDV95DRAFT_631492 [Massariosphaeria phaeospora]|uniref:Uncharacterized protein n=1 Tax=Massariosphaeria phaeospora TaxID=100035 RepID=A0A7C8M3P3_9PLEO|nr:hypothetical protein BDV95DRAFT_631492 [Massariosphaeria phaeospora]
MSPSAGVGSNDPPPPFAELAFHDKKGSDARPPVEPPVTEQQPRICGMRKRWFIVSLTAIMACLIAVGLGVGLGLGLGRKGKDSPATVGHPYCRNHPELCIGGTLDPNFYSKKGAFNGSGIAVAGQAGDPLWEGENTRMFTLYFQHWTGDLRSIKYTGGKKWIGGTKEQTVATDAKSATPISTVAFKSQDNSSIFHVFYISKDNIIKQVTQTNKSKEWTPGPLNKHNLRAFDSPSVGLQACWKGNYYGEADYSKFPTPSGNTNEVPLDARLGINIWFATDETTFQQYTWYEGKEEWLEPKNDAKRLGMNGHAGVGCYSWGPGTVQYFMINNRYNGTEIWWKDTNWTSTDSSDAHVINTWVNATDAAITGLHPATSLGYTTYLFGQMADNTVSGFNVTFSAENSTVPREDEFTISTSSGPAKGLGGTHLTNTAFKLNVTGWKDNMFVFYQTEGDDITVFTRSERGSEWMNESIPIPHD